MVIKKIENIIINVFGNEEKLFGKICFTIDLLNKKALRTGKNLYLALSGGNTPGKLYEYILQNYGQIINWENIHFFWSDERCVDFDSSESNSGAAYRSFLSQLNIPKSNIHFPDCLENAGKSATYYENIIKSLLPAKNGLPVFDIIFLGLGEDGHTASIFPDQTNLLKSEKLVDVSVHPVSGQNRITFTPKLMNNAGNIFFLVMGEKKSGIVQKIIMKNNYNGNVYPVNLIKLLQGNIIWFLDTESAKNLV